MEILSPQLRFERNSARFDEICAPYSSDIEQYASPSEPATKSEMDPNPARRLDELRCRCAIKAPASGTK